MAEGLAVRRDTAPFQLWDDLGCKSLHDFHPIEQAAFEARYKWEQRRQGVLLLAECHLEGPRIADLVAGLPHG